MFGIGTSTHMRTRMRMCVRARVMTWHVFALHYTLRRKGTYGIDLYHRISGHAMSCHVMPHIAEIYGQRRTLGNHYAQIATSSDTLS